MAGNTIADKLDSIDDSDTRKELRRVYDEEKKRVGWAQAAETLGNAVAKYGAARQGVTGLDTPTTDWERRYDRILGRYGTDLRDLGGREAERARRAERQADRDLRVSEGEKSRAAALQLEGIREKARAAKEAAELERRKKQGDAVEELSGLKETEKSQRSRLKSFQSALSKYRDKKTGNLDPSKLDDNDEVEGLLTKLESEGIIDSEVRSQVLEQAGEDNPLIPNFLEDEYDGSKVIDILHSLISSKSTELSKSKERIPSTTRRARGFPSAGEVDRVIDPQDAAALKWARDNVEDPRAKAILDKLGS